MHATEDPLDNGIPGFVRWFNKILAPWAGFQGMFCVLLGVTALVYGTGPENAPGTEVFAAMVLASLVSAFGVRSMARKRLEKAGPEGHLIATVVFGTVVVGSLGVAILLLRPPA